MFDRVVKWGSIMAMSFEQDFAGWLPCCGVFAFWKGRVAMYGILKSMGIGPGDEVIVPGYTCVMAVNPIKYLQAKPVYVDIDPVTYNMDASLIAAGISPRTKAIIAQHTYGYPCDMAAIMEVASRHDIPIVEDCCLALGSKYKGRYCGTFGVAANFSFQWNKTMTTGLGGLAAVQDEGLAGALESLRRESLCSPTLRERMLLDIQRGVHNLIVYPRTNALITTTFRYLVEHKLVIGSSSPGEYEPKASCDFFKDMGNSQMASVRRQFWNLEKNIEHRKRMQRLYEGLLQECGHSPVRIAHEMEPVLVRYPVRVRCKPDVLRLASKRGLEIGSWFESPLHPSETNLGAYDYRTGSCPEAEKACGEVVNLPLHHRVSEGTARRTVSFIKNHLLPS